MLHRLKQNEFYTSTNKLEILEPLDNSLNNFIYKEIFEYQIYNVIPEMKIKNENVVIDVGAHIGIFSRYAAVNGSSRVIAIEMDPRNFSCLKQNVRLEDDVFNCVLLDKIFTKFKLENDILITGFTLDYFFEGELFNKVDFLKIDIFGQEQCLLKTISQKVYNVIDRISVKMYKTNDENKNEIINFMKSRRFYNFYNITIPNYPIQLLYFWK